jgi:long-chain acyl-CoA synthetase
VGLLRRGLEEFGPIFIQSYGQSESGPNITSFPRYEHQVLDLPPERQRVLASAGRPCIGVQVRIVDEDGRELPTGETGEITVRSKSLMVGYWRKPEETAKTIINGWLHTGDVGRLDEEGYLYLVDRKKDMIVTGGENVYPYEVEAVLHQHSVVRDVAVIALPDPYWVERVHAVIVKEPGAPVVDDATLTDELRAFCRQSLAGFKVPKSIEFVPELPRNPGGKILRRVLRDERV